VTSSSICLLPKLTGTGGPSSFQSKLKKGFKELGINVTHNPRDPTTSAILVTGGTRQFDDLVFAKSKGIRIIQRLDGMNWLHKKKMTGIRHYFRSERMNLQLSFTRRMFADAVVYQSHFTCDWWNEVYGALQTPHTVIHNGVDLGTFAPDSKHLVPIDSIRILVVEGSFKGGHERDLLNAVELANHLSDRIGKPIELLIAGNLPQSMKKFIKPHSGVKIKWLGIIPHEEIPNLDRSAHIIFPAEINAACPNSLIEALACGLPAVSYATGSLPELIGEDGGIVVPYGSDHWNLKPPDVETLTQAAENLINDLPNYRTSARKRAEELFDVQVMVEKYRQILFDDPGTFPT
jgi:glycosyltransferase involved in cell wall biosynthesis